MYYCKNCKNAEMHVQIQYVKERLVHVVRNQKLLNMQKITLRSANNAILLIKGIYNNSVLNR